MLKIKNMLAYSMVLLSFGCSQIPEKPASLGVAVSAGTTCPAQRSQICTLEYNPVCGKTASGVLTTYGNACSACGDVKVVSYTAGECHAK